MGSAQTTLKQKARHEAKEMVELFLYLAFFFAAVVLYDMFLLDRYHSAYLNFGFAVLNALVVTKVIMIGEYAKLAKRFESKPLLLSTVWKAGIFCLLVFFFQALEEVAKALIHGTELAQASHEVRFDRLAARIIVVFCAFVPLFGFRELRRVMSEEEFRRLVFGATWAKE
jgi:hypothetical protein